ncbi:MAG TPA: DUF1080 domain-containing protein [Verrucomicrobiae bacterium]|nr:DUF1080 domain-containing protein [Verrucomicrobiae bacterium]
MRTRIAISGKFHLFIFLTSMLLLIAGCASDSKPAGGSSNVNVQIKPEPAKPEPSAPVAPAPPANTNAAQNEVDAQIKKAAAERSAPMEGTGWKPLFDGHSLNGWAVTDFAGHGAASVESGLIVVDLGDALSGINYTNGGVPTMNYEIALDAMKLNGSDFFCGLTFPVADSWCSLILGGWGGGVVGISSINGDDASENETSQLMKFDNNHWYRVRARVTGKKIQCWLDDKKIVDVNTTGKTIGLRFGEIELSKPLGIATYQTTAAFRNIQIRQVEESQ